MKIKNILICLTALLLCMSAFAGCLEVDEDVEEERQFKLNELDQDYYGQFRDQNISINVYNWGEYISNGFDGYIDINKEFEKLTGIRVNYTTFATNEELYAKLRGGGSNYDVIIPSDYMIARMIKENMLLKLDVDKIPSLKYIDETFINPDYDPTNEYSVPYMWGTAGIIYNTMMIDEEIDSWSILWDERFKGDILMFGNPRDAFGIALFMLGYSVNTEDPDILRSAAELLKQQKPLVQAYVMDEIFDKMEGGEAALAPYYAGDALVMMEENEYLAFVVPKEGTNLFVDAMCIPNGARNKDAAQMYINFLCEPFVSAENAEYVGYSTPNIEAFLLLDEETRENEIAYPSSDVLEKTETYTNLSDAANLILDSLWVEIISSDQRYGRLMMPVFIIIALATSVAITIIRHRNKKREQLY